MKNYRFIIWAMAALPCMAVAQQPSPIQAAYYEVEGVTVYEAWAAPPGSNLAFYSQKGGGRLLKDAAVGESGGVKITALPGFAPPMVVNNGPGGSKMVAYYNDKAFVLDALEATAAAGGRAISWKASVADAANTTFTVLASADGILYKPVSTMPAQQGGMVPYSFAEEAPGSYYYRIRLHNSHAGLSYTSRTLHINPLIHVQVYPTAARSHINIALPAAYTATGYELVQADGSIAGNGICTAAFTTIDISALAPGSYIIRIFNKEGQPSLHKFIKL